MLEIHWLLSLTLNMPVELALCDSKHNVFGVLGWTGQAISIPLGSG